jgi:hypothetical protein
MADIKEYWNNLPAATKNDWKDKHPDIATDDNIASHAFHLESGRIYGENPDGKVVSTGALKLMAPKKFSAFARFLLDGVVVARKAAPYMVPGALRYEEKAMFYNLLTQQCMFMENHRNIQIRNIAAADLTTPGLTATTIHQVISGSDSVLRITHDIATKCLNISVQKETYIAVLDWLEETLATHGFGFNPQVKRTTPSRRPTSPTASRYSGLFTEAASVNVSFDPSTVATRRSAWNSRPPVMISYAHEDTEFPPLETPTKATALETPDNKSTVTNTAFDESSMPYPGGNDRKYKDNGNCETID